MGLDNDKSEMRLGEKEGDKRERKCREKKEKKRFETEVVDGE